MNLPPLDPKVFELSLEQAFELSKLEAQLRKASPELLLEVCLQMAKLLTIKDNIIRSILGKRIEQ